MKKRRTFARDCNLAAVKKMIERGLSYPELACDLGKKRPARADKKKRIQPIADSARKRCQGRMALPFVVKEVASRSRHDVQSGGVPRLAQEREDFRSPLVGSWFDAIGTIANDFA